MVLIMMRHSLPWSAIHGQILTLDNLMLRGRPLANCCCMCCCNAESVDHLLLSCPIAHSLWMYVYDSVVWDRLGHARFSCGLIILLVSLAWEA